MKFSVERVEGLEPLEARVMVDKVRGPIYDDILVGLGPMHTWGLWMEIGLIEVMARIGMAANMSNVIWVELEDVKTMAKGAGRV